MLTRFRVDRPIARFERCDLGIVDICHDQKAFYDNLQEFEAECGEERHIISKTWSAEDCLLFGYCRGWKDRSDWLLGTIVTVNWSFALGFILGGCVFYGL